MISSDIECTVECTVCSGQYFQSKQPGDRCENCSMCLVCGDDMPTSPDQKYDTLCSPECESIHAQRVIVYLARGVTASEATRKAREYAIKRRHQIFERDGWMCHLCGDPVNTKAKWPAGDSPVLDHVIPRSKGGHNRRTNLKTAHALCNNIRKDTDLAVYLASEYRISPYKPR